MNHLSLKLSRHLSSLTPGFEGHWRWCSNYIFHHTGKEEKELIGEPFLVCEKEKFDKFMGCCICPAWQVEDVLKNLDKLFPDEGGYYKGDVMCEYLIQDPDTAYQKIEEYLWTVFK